jgi:hypothetical protein
VLGRIYLYGTKDYDEGFEGYKSDLVCSLMRDFGIPPRSIGSPDAVITPSERKPDPVLALIEDHKKANAEYGEVCREVVPGTCSPDPEKEEQYGARETEVRDDLATTVPTTLEGILAVLTYVEAVSEGKLSAEGRRDNAFDDSLIDIIISAQDCLASHLGVQAAK